MGDFSVLALLVVNRGIWNRSARPDLWMVGQQVPPVAPLPLVGPTTRRAEGIPLFSSHLSI